MNNDSVRDEAFERDLREAVRHRQHGRRFTLSEGFVASLVARLPAVPDPSLPPARRRWFRSAPVGIAASLLVVMGGLVAYLQPVFSAGEGLGAGSLLTRAYEATTSFALATQATMAPTDLAAVALVSITAVLLCAYRLAPILTEA